jgi:hypothetical protein
VSTAAGVGMTAAPEADKAGTSAPPATEGEGGDHGTSGPQEELPSRGIFAEGMEAVNDEDRCLYVGTRGRRRLLPTAATSRSSRRRHTQSVLCCW